MVFEKDADAGRHALEDLKSIQKVRFNDWKIAAFIDGVQFVHNFMYFPVGFFEFLFYIYLVQFFWWFHELIDKVVAYTCQLVFYDRAQMQLVLRTFDQLFKAC